jgi:hypothetical protein
MLVGQRLHKPEVRFYDEAVFRLPKVGSMQQCFRGKC